MATTHTVLTIYLHLAQLCLKLGKKEQGLRCMALALGECNRNALLTIERKHVMRGLNYARKI